MEREKKILAMETRPPGSKVIVKGIRMPAGAFAGGALQYIWRN
jgi:hypothetical protein